MIRLVVKSQDPGEQPHLLPTPRPDQHPPGPRERHRHHDDQYRQGLSRLRRSGRRSWRLRRSGRYPGTRRKYFSPMKIVSLRGNETLYWPHAKLACFWTHKKLYAIIFNQARASLGGGPMWMFHLWSTGLSSVNNDSPSILNSSAYPRWKIGHFGSLKQFPGKTKRDM